MAPIHIHMSAHVAVQRPETKISFSLGRNASVDAFVKGASGLVGGEFLLVLFEDCNVMLRQAWDLVDILDRFVWSIAGNLSSRMREHARQLLVLAL